MPFFPRKLQAGMPFRPSIVSTINDIIEYLKSQRLVSDNKTIRINQLTSGISISALPQTSAPASTGGNVEFNHPFKLSIAYNQTLEKDVLHIHKGRIALNGDDESRIYVCFQPNTEGFDTYIPLPQEEGLYNVELLVFYDENTSSPNQNFWQIRVVYREPSNQSAWTNSVGFFQIYLGDVQVVENDDNSLSYSVIKQNITSGFSVYDCGITDSFQAYYTLSDYPDDGDVLDSNLQPDGITINAGTVYIQDSVYDVSSASFELTSNSPDLYLLVIDTVLKSASIARQNFAGYVFTEDTRNYNVPICRVIKNGASLYGLEQYINNDFCFSIVENKVLLNQNDKVAGYLQQKLKYPIIDYNQQSSSQKDFYDNGNSYILGVRYAPSSDSSISNSSLSSDSSPAFLYEKLFWNYRGISGYNDESSSSSNFQTIVNDNNSLTWKDYGKLRINGNDVAPAFLDDKIGNGQFIYKAVQNNQLKIWTRALKAGYNTVLTDGYYNNNQQQPYVQITTHQTNVSAGSGIKITTTNSDNGYTKSHHLGIDYANFAISGSNGITVTKESSGITVSLSSLSTGIVIVSGGSLSVIEAPSTPSVLAWNDGYSWIPLDTCQMDCSSSSASSASVQGE